MIGYPLLSADHLFGEIAATTPTVRPSLAVYRDGLGLLKILAAVSQSAFGRERSPFGLMLHVSCGIHPLLFKMPFPTGLTSVSCSLPARLTP